MNGLLKATRRIIEVRIAFDIPNEMAALAKDVSLSFHAQEIVSDSRAVQVPWTDAVRLVGTDDVFAIRMKVPTAGPCFLHALALIDEPGNPKNKLIVRRHIGFANHALTLESDRALMCVSHFESYSLVIPQGHEFRIAI